MNETAWIFEGIRALGIAGGPVFAVLWWLERGERLDCQKTTRELLVQVLTITQQTTNSVNVVATTVSELREATKDSINALSQLVGSLRKPTP